MAAKTKKERFLENLEQKKYGASLKDAEKALEEWGFVLARDKGASRVWNYKHVTLTLHVPHGKGGKVMKAGAVATVIKKIEEAELLQQQEKATDEH